MNLYIQEMNMLLIIKYVKTPESDRVWLRELGFCSVIYLFFFWVYYLHKVLHVTHFDAFTLPALQCLQNEFIMTFFCHNKSLQTKIDLHKCLLFTS